MLSDQTDQTGDSVITSVEQQQKNTQRYNVFIQEEYAFSVHEDILISHRLLKGQTINKTRIEKILKDEEQQKALHHALRFVGRKPRSIKEVKQMLKLKGYEADLITRVIEKLVEQQYLNDEQFAKTWTEHRIFSQNKGRKWVQQELLNKGIPKEDIINAMESINEEEELKCALDLGLKKWNQITEENQVRKRKVGMFLLRRGYSNSLVSKVLNDLQSRNEDR